MKKKKNATQTTYPHRRKMPPSYTVFKAGPAPTKVQELCATYGMPRVALPRLSGFSQRAIDNWAAGNTPSGSAAKRLTELERLFAALARLVDSKSIGPWLNRAND